MKRRNIVRLVSFLSAIIVVLSGVIVVNYQKNEGLKLQIKNNYSKNLNDFSASLNNISLILKKAQYVTTPARLSQMAAELLTEAEISKTALSQLPSGTHLDTLNRFLSQAGNYAFAVSGKLYSDNELPQDYSNNIAALSQTAEKVSKIVNTAQIDFDNSDYWAKEIEDKIDSEIDTNLISSLQEIEGELSDYPTLVYDGPYSDHILEEEPLMIKDAPEVTKENAKKKASDFAQASQLEFVNEENGKIPTYRFGNENTDITVSRQGGYVVYMRKNRAIENHIISYKQALEKAKRFLENNALSPFIETYYFIDEGVCVINFAFLDGQTICYTDLVKVGIAMDNGEIMLYEASGYISNHTERAFPTAEYTVEQAQEKVSQELKVLKTSLALIPTKKGKEERCYEFLCVDGDTEVLVYINVLTLEQEEILILFKNDGGTLAK